MKKLLLTFGVGSHVPCLELALPGFARFACRHGYDLLVSQCEAEGRPLSWGKIPALRKALADYDLVLWLDADCVIMDSQDDIAASVPAEAWQALVAWERCGSAAIPSCGVWLLRPPMLPILEAVWQNTARIDHFWWEQAALIELMGYEIIDRRIRMKKSTELAERTCFLPMVWNSSPQHHVSGARILHATKTNDRVGQMRQWVNTLNGCGMTAKQNGRRTKQQVREEFICRFIKRPPGAMYDIGVGLKSEWLTLKHVYHDMQLFGCEPHPEERRKILKAGFPGPLLDVAIGELSGRASLRLHASDSMSSSIMPIAAVAGEVDVEMWTLDQFDAHVGSPDRILLWMDIEGSELAALRGGCKLLSSGRVRWINLEERRDGHSPTTGWCQPQEIQALLSSHGFRRITAYNRHATHQDVIYVHQVEER